MNSGIGKNLDSDKNDHRFRYMVLFTDRTKQVQLVKAMSERFPKERGCVFIPQREYWIRKTKSFGKKPLFPGYIFVHTDMNQKELYLFVREIIRDIRTFAYELTVKELKISGSPINDEVLSELTEEETDFLDRMLDDEGVERMSVGYREGDRYVIVEGPLKGMEEHIVGSRPHDREAYLDVSFRERKVVVGLVLRAKNDLGIEENKERSDNNTLILSDGARVDLKDLANKMMSGQDHKKGEKKKIKIKKKS